MVSALNRAARLRPRTGAFFARCFAAARAVTATMLLSACAPLHYLNRPPDEVTQSRTIVRIANETTRSYRVSLVVVANGAVHELGTVPALVTHSFELTRIATLGYGEVQLIAIPRGGSTRQDSDLFTLVGATTVVWRIDATLSRSVTVR